MTRYPNEPGLVPTAINGLPTISFDGATQYFTLPSGFANFNTITFVTIGGAPPSGVGSGETITIAGHNASCSLSFTDTNTSIATKLTTAINALALSGVSATSSGAVIQITAPLATTITATPAESIYITVQPPGATLFIVTAPKALTANARIFDLGDAASGNNILCQIASSGSLGQFSAYSGTSPTNAQSATALTQNQYQVLAAVQAPGATHGTATFYLNGAPGTSNTSMDNFPNTSRTSNFIGQGSSGGNFYAGNICELLLYQTSLTTSQIEAITGMLAQKYQLFSQVPTAPVISVPTSTLNGPTQVTISAEPGAVVRITTDGSTPTAASPGFVAPLTINYTQTLKAVAFKNGLQSSVTSATYTLDSSQWPAPSPSDMTAPSINLQLPAPSL